MTCSGCSGAINRVLTKAQKEGTLFLSHLPYSTLLINIDVEAGITSFDVSLENQTAVVTGTISEEDLTARIAKTGKQVRLDLCLRPS